MSKDSAVTSMLPPIIFFLIPGIPRNMSFSVVQEAFLSVEGIVAVHNLRIWGLTTDKTALSAHLAISKLRALRARALVSHDVIHKLFLAIYAALLYFSARV